MPFIATKADAERVELHGCAFQEQIAEALLRKSAQTRTLLQPSRVVLNLTRSPMSAPRVPLSNKVAVLMDAAES